MQTPANKKPPFFVLGSQRSGTTMLRLMMNNHPNLAIPHETGFFVQFREAIDQYGDLAVKENAAKLLEDISRHHLVRRGGHITNREAILDHPIRSFPDLIDAILTEYAISHGKQRWGDKTPCYTLYIEVLWKLFPGCKIIHLVRDGRDVALSQRKIEWMSNSLPTLAADWQMKTLICHKVGSVLGKDHFLELKYENLVTDTESTLRSICGFLDEPFTDDMLEYHRNAKAVVPSASLKWHGNSVQAPDPDKLYKWQSKMSKSDRIIFEQVAGQALKLFGYELEGHKSTLASRLKSLYYATVVRW